MPLGVNPIAVNKYIKTTTYFTAMTVHGTVIKCESRASLAGQIVRLSLCTAQFWRHFVHSGRGKCVALVKQKQNIFLYLVFQKSNENIHSEHRMLKAHSRPDSPRPRVDTVCSKVNSRPDATPQANDPEKDNELDPKQQQNWLRRVKSQQATGIRTAASPVCAMPTPRTLQTRNTLV